MSRGWGAIAWAIGLAVPAQPAGAAWYEATSAHFVVYSEAGEAGVRQLATRLERLDAALEQQMGRAAEANAAANKVRVYELYNIQAVADLYGAPGSSVAGFYVPRASGSVAFTPRVVGDAGTMKPETILFHEYAHHFLLGRYAAAFPAWYSEGFAEFVSTATFSDKGVQIGAGAQHRAWGLSAINQLSIERLLDPDRRAMTPQQLDQLYGRGWLLTHYLYFNPVRGKQLGPYLRLLNTGTKPLDAARQAFGDLKQLDREIRRYLEGRLWGITFPVDAAPPVTVRRLSAGEEATVDLRIASERGVDRARAAALWAKARRLLGNPAVAGNAVAQGWIAEMAFDAGQDAEAEAAADRALAIDGRSAQALLYKGRVRLRRAAVATPANPAAWKEARSWIVRANRLEPDDAEPLILYHASFGAAGEAPTPAAIKGLHRAVELVPQDPGLRFAAAVQELRDGKVDDARRVLRPLAFSPHAPADNPAARALAALDEGKDAAAALALLAGEKPKS